jgi:hypothetical protein
VGSIINLISEIHYFYKNEKYAFIIFCSIQTQRDSKIF